MTFLAFGGSLTAFTTLVTESPMARTVGGMPDTMMYVNTSGRITHRSRNIMARLMFFMAVIISLCGCVYKGGKVVDGTNLAIGMKIPGTDWSVNLLDYVGGMRVAGQDSTHITVSNEVMETNTYFGCVTTTRHTRLTAEIEPLNSARDSDGADGLVP